MLEAFQKWRSNESDFRSHQAPLLVGMSANAPETDQNSCFAFGMHIFVNKPVDTTVLQMIVDECKGQSHIQDILKNLERRLKEIGMSSRGFSGDRGVRIK